jgi:hypothetical protein
MIAPYSMGYSGCLTVGPVGGIFLQRYGPWQTVYDRFGHWQKQGVVERILQALHLELDEQGLIELERSLYTLIGPSPERKSVATPAALLNRQLRNG